MHELCECIYMFEFSALNTIENLEEDLDVLYLSISWLLRVKNVRKAPHGENLYICELSACLSEYITFCCLLVAELQLVPPNRRAELMTQNYAERRRWITSPEGPSNTDILDKYAIFANDPQEVSIVWLSLNIQYSITRMHNYFWIFLSINAEIVSRGKHLEPGRHRFQANLGDFPS